MRLSGGVTVVVSVGAAGLPLLAGTVTAVRVGPVGGVGTVGVLVSLQHVVELVDLVTTSK